jgi:hypothetical protein
VQNSYSFTIKGYPDNTRREDQISPALASSADLFFSCFLGDVNLELDGISFTTRFGWVATLSFAIGLVQHLTALPMVRRSTLEFQEAKQWVSLLLDDGKAYVSCSYANGIASVSYKSFLEMTRDGLERHINDLNTFYPGLTENASLRRQLKTLG